MKKYIIIRTQFEATHNWPDCPIEEVAFLREEHRHIFHVEVKIEVSHNNRELEFIMLKRIVNELLQSLGKRLGTMSCEDIAERIITTFCNHPIKSVSVFEDNENGAIIEL